MFSNIQTGTLWWKNWQFCYIGYDFRVKNVQAKELDIRFMISTVPSLPQIILPPFNSKSKSIWLAFIILTTTGRTCILNICLTHRLAWGNNVPKYSTIHQNHSAKPLTTVYPDRLGRSPAGKPQMRQFPRQNREHQNFGYYFNVG